MTFLLIFLAVILLVFVPLNWLVYSQLTKIHPRRRRWIIGALIAGNLMYALIPLMRSFTPSTRILRALLAPLWFGWTSFALVYALFLLLVLIAWLPRRKQPFAQFARQPSRVLLILLITGFLVGWYQALVPLRIEHVRVAVPGLPAAAEGTRIALMGDLHVGLFTRASRLEKIFRAAGQLQPHAVAIAGDLIDDDPYFVPKLLRGATALRDDIPIFAVLGNHEIYGNPRVVIDGLRGSRIRLLVNEGLPWRGVWLAGLSDKAAVQRNRPELAPDLPKSLQGRSSEPVVLLSHQPSVIEEARRKGVAAVLSAHTHGGQLGFRPLGISLAGLFLRYHMGLYDLGATRLYINTGTGYWVFPFRLGMTPEITLIELVRA